MPHSSLLDDNNDRDRNGLQPARHRIVVGAVLLGIVALAVISTVATNPNHDTPPASSRPASSSTLRSGRPSRIHRIFRLGIVVSPKAPVTDASDITRGWIGLCSKGQFLAVAGESNEYYGILMAGGKIGLISKSKVIVLKYTVKLATHKSAHSESTSNDSDAELGMNLVSVAQTYLGVPYLYGGESRAGIDCSAFVRAVYAQCGIDLPRTAAEQSSIGVQEPTRDINQWMPGDRLYFRCTHDYIDHTAMYIGQGLFIQSEGGFGVRVTNARDNYYFSHLVMVRRSSQVPPTQ